MKTATLSLSLVLCAIPAGLTAQASSKVTIEQIRTFPTHNLVQIPRIDPARGEVRSGAARKPPMGSTKAATAGKPQTAEDALLGIAPTRPPAAAARRTGVPDAGEVARRLGSGDVQNAPIAEAVGAVRETAPPPPPEQPQEDEAPR